MDNSPNRLPQQDLVLPVEILIDILGFLNSLDLARCRLVSTHFDLTIRTTSSLQFIIELGVGGYEAGPCPKLNLVDRVEALRNVQQIWRNPRPVSERAILDVPLPAGWRVKTWMVVDGIFVRQSSFEGFGAPNNPDIEFHTRIDLVNLHEVIEGSNWITRTLNFPMKSIDVYLDMDQELIILIGVESTPPLRVYFESYRDGKPHPRVANEALVVTPSTQSSEYTVCVQEVVGDLVLIATEPGDSELNTINLYHWPSSTLIKSWVSSPSQIYEDVVIPVPGYLLVLGFSRQDLDTLQPMVQVYALSGPLNFPDPITLLANFFMPSLSHTWPSSTYWTAHNASAERSGVYDFCTSRYTLLHIRLLDAYSLFTPLRTFLTDTVKAKAADLDSPPLLFSWNQWGPQNTRYLHQPDVDLILAGYHVILTNEIWDFSPRGVSQSFNLEPCQGSLQTDTTIEFHNQGQTKVETYLPYRQIPLALPTTEPAQYLRYLAEDSTGPQLVQITLLNPMVVDIVTF